MSPKWNKLQLNAVVGHCTLSPTQVIAWYVLAPRSISFRPDDEVENIIIEGARGLATQVNRRCYFRVTSQPFAARDWAEATWKDAEDATDGPLPEAAQLMVRQQVALFGAEMPEKFAFIGVRIATRRKYKNDPVREVFELRREIDSVTSAMTHLGLEGTPASPSQMELLLRRSIALGLPAPQQDVGFLGDYKSEDIPLLEETVEITALPWAKTCHVRGINRSGDVAETELAVLTLGRIEDLQVPQDGYGGWMQRSDYLDFPVEWMGTIDVIPNKKTAEKVRSQLDKVQDQYAHWVEEHGKPAPPELERLSGEALAIEDEISVGISGTSTRTECWFRLAVWGDTVEEVEERVTRVKETYGSRVEWWWSRGQAALIREFVPNEPLASSASKRRFPVTSVMAALPAATATVGDSVGCVIGETAGTSRRPFIWHPWKDMQAPRNRSGLLVLTGGLGSGKSVAMGALIYLSAMMGSRWTVFDPSARLARLCELPELAPYARHTNLMDGVGGELNPFRVLVDPDRRYCESEADFLAKFAEQRAARTQLCRDTLTALLPKGSRENRHEVAMLASAVRRVDATNSASPREVLAHLQAIATNDYRAVGEHHMNEDRMLTNEHRVAARQVQEELQEFAETAMGKLVFGDSPTQAEPGDRILLHVYSMHGLSIPTPEQLKRGDESSRARQSLALFNLAAWLTQQSIYLGDPHERKGLAIDEAHMLAFEEGQRLIAKSSVDTRKHNTRFILCSQNVSHFDVDEIAPLAGAVMVGRTTSEEAAFDALKMASLAQSPSYAALLKRLSPHVERRQDETRKLTTEERREQLRTAPPHEFLFSTKELGQVEKVTVDLRPHPHVLEALLTSADPTQRRPRRVYDEDQEVAS